MLLAATWLDLEIIILSEVSQRKINIIWYHLHAESKKWCKRIFIYKTEIVTSTENKLMVGVNLSRGKDKLGDWD